MIPKGKKYPFYVILLIIASTLIRAFLAANLELGNDEVYYRLYALYPDWSHFDHPPMVGLVIQMFSLDLLLNSELFIRMGAVILGAFNIWFIYQIGKTVRNERTGFYASLLYFASIYSTVIAGIFILPDTPQSFFWLLTILVMVKFLPTFPVNRRANQGMLLLGFLIGLGILSKYTSVFLWLGAGLYILLYRRDWLKKPSLYLALAITLLCSLPVLVWNINNDFISFTFHADRLNTTGYTLNFNYFLQEIAGEILYNNPVNFILVILSLISILRGKLKIRSKYIKILVFSSIPLVVVFLIFSLSRSTLPHWSAPAYTTMIILSAAWLDQNHSKKLRMVFLSSAVSLLLLTLFVGYGQIKYGLISTGADEEYHRKGKNDISLDLYGFEQTGEQFREIVTRDISKGVMNENSILVGDNWFPLANFDYYAASPVGMPSFGIGDLDHLHKYAWINEIRGGFKMGMDAYYLTDSRYYREPGEAIKNCFDHVEAADTIQIYRNGEVVKRAFVFRLKNLVKMPEDPFEISR